MGKAKRRKQRARSDKQSAERQPATASPKSSLWRKWGKSIAIIVSIIGFASALLSIDPKLTVSLGEAFDEGNFESLPFETTNDSPYAVDWIRHTCIIHKLTYKDGTQSEMPFNSFPAIHKQERLGKGRGRTTFCVLNLIAGEKKIEAADISLMVVYKPWFSPMELQERFRFQVGPDKTGKLRALRLYSSDDVSLSF